MLHRNIDVMRAKNTRRGFIIRFSASLITALFLAVSPGGHVESVQAAAHPQMSCDVNASSRSSSLGAYVTIDMNCDFWSFEDHPDLEGQEQQMVIFQGSYASEPFSITLGERFSFGDSHSDMYCTGTLLFEPDASGYSFSSRYFLTLLCRERFGFASMNSVPHPDMYCQPTYSGMQSSAFEMECWAISTSLVSKRRWSWVHPDGTLIASFRGKKNGQVIVRTADPYLTQVTLRQWAKGNTTKDIVIPIVDGVGIYQAPTKKWRTGTLDVGLYQIEGIGGYYVRSTTIIWGR